MVYGITPAGFTIKPFNVILQESSALIKDIDSTAIINTETVYGQIAIAYAEREFKLQQLFQLLYESRNIVTASGRSLDDLVAYNNIIRLPATRSFIADYRIEGDEGTVIPEGFRIASTVNGDIKFETIEEYVIPVAEFIEVPVRCLVTGPIAANPNTVTIMETPVSGVTDVSHAQAAIVGRAIETDAELKLRRLENVVTTRGSTISGIIKRLSELNLDVNKPALKFIDVVENDKPFEDDRGRPAHSIEVIIDTDGIYTRDQEIAEAIFEAHGAGTGIFGEKEFTVLDNRNRERHSAFTNPIAVYIEVAVTCTVTTALSEDQKTFIRQEIVDQGNKLSVGENVTVIGGSAPLSAIELPEVVTSADIQVRRVGGAYSNIVVIEDGMLGTPEKAVFTIGNVTVLT